MKKQVPTLTTGQKVKTARLKADLTQQEVADAVGVTVVTISRIENDRHSPRVSLLDKITAACR